MLIYVFDIYLFHIKNIQQVLNTILHQTEELFENIPKSKCNFVCRIYQKCDVSALIIHHFNNNFYSF